MRLPVWVLVWSQALSVAFALESACACMSGDSTLASGVCSAAATAGLLGACSKNQTCDLTAKDNYRHILPLGDRMTLISVICGVVLESYPYLFKGLFAHSMHLIELFGIDVLTIASVCTCYGRRYSGERMHVQRSEVKDRLS